MHSAMMKCMEIPIERRYDDIDEHEHVYSSVANGKVNSGFGSAGNVCDLMYNGIIVFKEKSPITGLSGT